MISWRIAGGLAAASVVLCAAAAWQYRGEALRRAKGEAEQALGQARAAVQTTKIIERTTNHERVIVQRVEADAHAIQAAPGGQTPVPHDVLVAWHDAVERMRAPGGAGEGPAP
jgi:hypothetical protein